MAQSRSTSPLSLAEKVPLLPPSSSSSSSPSSQRRRRPLLPVERLLPLVIAVICLCGITRYATTHTHVTQPSSRPPLTYPSCAAAPTNRSCDTVHEGYRCNKDKAQFWGQYSPWFAVPTEIDVEPPKGCEITFANVLSRHGGRNPTTGKSATYKALIDQIKGNTTKYPGDFAFLKNYTYQLGEETLTTAGKQQMVNSGMHFFQRYKDLIKDQTPFVRAGGQERVIDSAQNWLNGFSQSQKSQCGMIDLVIPEGKTSNSTLSHDTCTSFKNKNGTFHKIGGKAQDKWAAKFIPPIRDRINSALGTNISIDSTIDFMDLCPYNTIADPLAKVSDFCHLFDEKEWNAYDYYYTLGKFYGSGGGNGLGPTQGVGYVNELLARLTTEPVQDSTNTNRSLDSDPSTFPLDRQVYADFSHDNDIMSVLAALGLYNNTELLSNTTLQDTDETNGFSAAWTVPFASRMYVEKMKCEEEGDEEFVRIVVNDRVQPLDFCDADKDNKCTLSKFVDSQSFAQQGGLWDQC